MTTFRSRCAPILAIASNLAVLALSYGVWAFCWGIYYTCMGIASLSRLIASKGPSALKKGVVLCTWGLAVGLCWILCLVAKYGQRWSVLERQGRLWSSAYESARDGLRSAWNGAKTVAMVGIALIGGMWWFLESLAVSQ